MINAETYTKICLLIEIGRKMIEVEERLFWLEIKLFGKANFNPNQPRVPAGNPDGGQWTRIDGYSETIIGGEMDDKLKTVLETWHNSKTFSRHYDDHGKDFGTTSPKDYAKQANNFHQRYKIEKLPAFRYPNGEIGVYDPKTNTYGLYTSNGKTITYYKPTSPTYFERQINTYIPKGGEVINPMSVKLPARGGAGLGGQLDFPKFPHENILPDDDLDN